MFKKGFFVNTKENVSLKMEPFLAATVQHRCAHVLYMISQLFPRHP